MMNLPKWIVRAGSTDQVCLSGDQEGYSPIVPALSMNCRVPHTTPSIT
jgi:hypothetical protein